MIQITQNLKMMLFQLVNSHPCCIGTCCLLTWCHIPEDLNLYQYCHKSLRSHTEQQAELPNTSMSVCVYDEISLTVAGHKQDT